ncbi:hypothetical protein S83_005819 [Arachis hypogaea]
MKTSACCKTPPEASHYPDPEIQYTFLLWNCPSFKLRDQTPQVPKFVLLSDWLGCIPLKASSIEHGLQSFLLLKEVCCLT